MGWGGEFALYSDLAFNNDRKCHEPRIEKTFTFRHNQGVLFLNSNRGFHGPTPIRRMAGLRKWIYFSIPSRRNVWTASPYRAVSKRIFLGAEGWRWVSIVHHCA